MWFLRRKQISPSISAPHCASAQQLHCILTTASISWTKLPPVPGSAVFCLVSTVLNDIISTMFNRKFMEELFKPQELYSKKALRTVYDRLAHASIMRLNQASMDKVSRQPPLSPGLHFLYLLWMVMQWEDVCNGALQKKVVVTVLQSEPQKSSTPILPLFMSFPLPKESADFHAPI